ncbi:MAG: hypothetical protein ACQEXQ_29950 [Bacillota bacterium]
MNKSTTCPNCRTQITANQIAKLPTPFHFKCINCKVKLRVEGFTYLSIALAAVLGVLLAMIMGEIKEWLVNILPFVIALPTVILFGIIIYPIVHVISYLNALYVVIWGDITIRE